MVGISLLKTNADSSVQKLKTGYAPFARWVEPFPEFFCSLTGATLRSQQVFEAELCLVAQVGSLVIGLD